MDADLPSLDVFLQPSAFSLLASAALTPPPLRRTLAATMPAGFDAAFVKGKELVADFWTNYAFYLALQFGVSAEMTAKRLHAEKLWRPT